MATPRTFRWRALAAAVVLAGACAAPAAGVERRQARSDAPVVEIVDLGIDSPEAWVHTITDSGVIMGGFRRGGNEDGTGHLFRWEDGSLIELEGTGGPPLPIFDVSARGVVVGTSTTADGDLHAVLWNADGTVVDLGAPGADSFARAINRRGVVAGAAQLDPSDPTVHAVTWRDGAMTVLDDPGGLRSAAWENNDRGQVIGSSVTDPEGGTRAVRWDRGSATVLELPGGRSSTATDINARGDVLVVSPDPDGVHHTWLVWDGGSTVRWLPPAFSALGLTDRGEVIGTARVTTGSGSEVSRASRLERDGTLVDLGTVAGWQPGTRATAFNQRGQVVGTARDAQGVGHSVLWDDDGEIIDLGTRFGSSDSAPQAINRRGQIAGELDTRQGTRAVMWLVHR
jgi:probable HAF family extracellular repeat protein